MRWLSSLAYLLLVRVAARENRWGAPRIHGELTKLGFDVCGRTVSRYLARPGPRERRSRSGTGQ